MHVTTGVAAAGVAGLVSLVLTGLVRRYALARALLDVPNARSSHTAPTPRGGGLAVAAVVLAGTLALGATGLLDGGAAAAVVGGGLLVAAIGWRDDRSHVPAAVRAAVHCGAGAWATWCLGGLPTVEIGEAALTLGAAGWLLAPLAIAWCVNLYNFMDGIDGIAGVEAVTVCGTLGGLLLASGETGIGILALITAGAAAGFLRWNWNPARVFMGDVGSGFLGFVIATLALLTERRSALPGATLVAILLAVFITDATITLARRAARGERWMDAHRSHAYQRAVQSGWTHGTVSVGVAALNIALAMLAVVAATHHDRALIALATGYALVLGAYLLVERRSPMRGAVRAGA